MMFKEYLIRELKEDDIKNALDLIWNVFEEFESPDYCNEGIKTFHKFIEYNSIIEKVKEKSLLFELYPFKRQLKYVKLSNSSRVLLCPKLRYH
ncbi:hypothetical protein [Clostridioides sp. ES-S-0108-01]|uniref:hypothetical protein n=1 Tax=Clostridioides sp. ES-S-0108-01 TaxID=2770773 RepID=UPI001D0CBFFB